MWPAADGRHGSYLERGVRVHRLTSVALPGKPKMHLCSPWAVRREIELIMQITRPDVVHVQSHLTLGRSLIRVARALEIPIVATNHFMPENLVHHVPVLRHFPQLVGRVAWRDLERVFADADLLTAPTSRAVQLLAASTKLPAAIAISCGIDLDKYRERAVGEIAHRPTVLFVGRLEDEKHVDELIRGFARIAGFHDAGLEIVGMGSRRAELEALAKELGVGHAVTFLGAISDDDLGRALSRADIFVMPGTAELQSLATLEAMSASRPVVAANAMALPHLVQNDVNGYLYPPGDVASLSGVLTRLLADPELRLRLGAASALRAQAHDLSATVSAFEHCYHAVVMRRPASDDAASADPAAVVLVS
jgi:glycosyltransferase involved in cell wall biosynthesis